MNANLKNKSILLIISGGIAAYKSLELIRLLKKAGAQLSCILTKGGAQFVTPLSVSALCEQQVYTDLWSLKNESEMGHIRLSREADMIVIAPASANIIAEMACGLACDLATTTLLAADKPALIVPAMNHMMWNNPATQANIETLKSRGHSFIGPEDGDMACGEYGPGRMSQPEEIFKTISARMGLEDTPILNGRKALVTSGPTYEPLDPVRFLGNRSSGKQGHAIATALMCAGADVTLVTGPVALPDPAGVTTLHIETADEMLSACALALPVDIAVCTAAVSDWSPAQMQNQKIKKSSNEEPASIMLKQNPDILKTLATHKNRPALVVGFAAETENLEEGAKTKLKNKKCDWILANLVGQKNKKIFGEDRNHVYLVNASGIQDWQPMSKKEVAERLTENIAEYFKTQTIQD